MSNILRTPWNLVWSAVGRHLVLGADNQEVLRPTVDIGQGWHAEEERWKAMAPLLSAAPDLFVACREVLRLWSYRGDDVEDFHAHVEMLLRAALAKAGGQSC